MYLEARISNEPGLHLFVGSLEIDYSISSLKQNFGYCTLDVSGNFTHFGIINRKVGLFNLLNSVNADITNNTITF